MQRRVANATRELHEAVEEIQATKEKNALTLLNKHFAGFMTKLIGSAFYRWKDMNDAVNDSIELERYRTGKMRKAVAMILSRTLKTALSLWKKHAEMLAAFRVEQKRAMKLMTKTMTKLLQAQVDAGFKHWHRNAMLHKEHALRKQARLELENARRKR
jgi:hypothetical protein